MRGYIDSGWSAATQVKAVSPDIRIFAVGQGLVCPEASIVADVIRRVCSDLPGRRTSRKKFSKACKEMNDWLRRVRCLSNTKDWWPVLAAKLRGHYQYYGVSGNSTMIGQFGYVTKRLLHKWLNRRSQRKSFTWKQLDDYLAHYPLPRPRIVHNLYQPSP